MAGNRILALAAAAAISLCVAAPGPGPGPGAAEARLAQLKAELALTPEQEAKVRPLVDAHVTRLVEIRSAHPGVPREMPPAERAALREELAAAQLDFDKKLETILTPEQIRKLQSLRDEMRQRVRERRAEAPRPSPPKKK